MTSLRTNAIRRALVGGVAFGVCLVIGTGCASRAPQAGGAAGSKPEKARKNAEMLAFNAVNGAASQQAKSVPEIRESRNVPFLWGKVVINRDTGDISLASGKTSVAAPAPPAPPTPPHPPAIPKQPEQQIVKGPPAPKSNPRPGSPPVIRERVVSTMPYLTEKEADDDALAQACDTVERKLAQLDPPVRYKPSVAEVQTEFIRKDSRTVRPPDDEEKATFVSYGLPGNLVYVEYDVEVTADQVRELRAQERVSASLRILGGLLAVVLAGFLFLRADEWTKGYLTSWLALGAIALAGGATVALIFM
ncbi:MAG: hypothetical protein L0241_10860 [Planctomycetia bacterium]|nr:hypothetical protein [Planctomycetia bacterium]